MAAYPNPVSFKGHYYQRSGSTTQELRGASLNRFLLEKQGKRWDGVPLPGVKVNDLESKSLKHFQARATARGRLGSEILDETTNVLVEKLHLKDGKYLKRACALLFHPDPEQFVTGAFIKIGFFDAQGKLLFQNDVHGSLFMQVEETLDLLLTKYLKASISIEGVQRVETYPVPEEALREALMNAIVHKDYASGTPIQISVYEDRLLTWNPGQLPDDWTIKNLLKKHSSRPFNPDLANAFFLAGYIESWGSGIDRMILECRSAKVPDPKLRYEAGGIWVEFVFSKNKAGVSTTSSGKTSGKTREETRLDEKLGKNRAGIVRMMQQKPKVTVTEISKGLGISRTAVDKNIQVLKSLKWIRRVGPAKGGQWKVLK